MKKADLNFFLNTELMIMIMKVIWYIIDNNDAILDDFVLQTNIKYYDNDEFHKLSKHLHQTNDFSLFHTNICSFNAKP